MTLYRTQDALLEAQQDFIRELPCCLCEDQAECAHIRTTPDGEAPMGMARRDHTRVVPLCPNHHRLQKDAQHNWVEKDWWLMHGIDPLFIAFVLWCIGPSTWMFKTDRAKAVERATLFLKGWQKQRMFKIAV